MAFGDDSAANVAVGYLLAAKQSAKGSPTVSGAKFFRCLDVDANPEIMSEDPEESGGDGRYIVSGYKSGHKHDGTWSFLARPDLTAAIFTYLLGIDTASGAGPYSHVLTPHSATFPWLTVERSAADGLIIDRVQDCRVKEVGIAFEGTKALIVSAAFAGIRGEWQASAQAASYETDEPWKMYEATFSIGGTEIETVRKGEFKLIQNLVEDLFTTKIYRHDIPVLGLRGELGLSVIADDDLYKAVVYNEGTTPDNDLYEAAFEASFTYGSGASKRTLTIKADNVRWAGAPVNTGGSGQVGELELAGKIFKSGSDDFCEITVINDESSAYV